VAQPQRLSGHRRGPGEIGLSPLEKAYAAVGKLKVFPLPSVVLFPGAAQPLHIFEPRYRAMVKDAISGDGVFAMAQLALGWEREYGGSPELLPLLSVGTLSVHQELEDGKFNVVLTGVSRARLIQEWPEEQGRLYREVQAELLPDPLFEGPEEAQLRQAVVELTSRLPEEVAARLSKVTTRVRGGAFVDVLASTLVSDVPRRYALLCELDVKKRMQRLLEEVSGVMTRLKPMRSDGFVN
jgi:Lon protease-like protein